MPRLAVQVLAFGFLLQVALFAVAFGSGHDAPLVFIVIGVIVTAAGICAAEFIRRHYECTGESA